jgi:hypothetical protein
MALLDVTEYRELTVTGVGHIVMAGQEPAVLTQQVAITPGSLQSAPLSDVTRFVRIHADATCRVAVGSNPVASASSMRMVAGGTEYLGVLPGLKIAVIASA